MATEWNQGSWTAHRFSRTTWGMSSARPHALHHMVHLEKTFWSLWSFITHFLNQPVMPCKNFLIHHPKENAFRPHQLWSIWRKRSDLFEVSSHIFQSASHGPAKTSWSIIQKKLPSSRISFCIAVNGELACGSARAVLVWISCSGNSICSNMTRLWVSPLQRWNMEFMNGGRPTHWRSAERAATIVSNCMILKAGSSCRCM